MEFVPLGLLLIGALIVCIGGIMLLVKAFQTSPIWGLGSLFVPPVAIIFVFMHWQEAKKPFLINVAGAAVVIVGIIMTSTSESGPTILEGIPE